MKTIHRSAIFNQKEKPWSIISGSYYNIKVEELRAKKLLECKSEALRLAEVIADSLVRALQIDPLSDPLYNPEIPDRPQYIPVDTSVFDSKHSVKPILW